MIFNTLLSKMNLMPNNETQRKPQNLLYAGLLASLFCFILLMLLSGYNLFQEQYSDKLFDGLEFSKVLGLMSFFILPIAFMSAMFLVFGTKIITYLMKIEKEGIKWLIAALLGFLCGLTIFMFSGKLIMIVIYTLTSVWGASFLSMLDLAIVKKDAFAEKWLKQQQENVDSLK